MFQLTDRAVARNGETHARNGETHARSAETARNIETVHRFLRLLEELDIDTWIGLFAEEADHYYPYGNEIFPPHLTGRAAIYDNWKATPDRFQILRLIPQEIWADGDTVLARFRSDSVLESGRKYYNTFLCIFKFNSAGEIREYWEYFDSIMASVDFGLAKVTYERRP